MRKQPKETGICRRTHFESKKLPSLPPFRRCLILLALYCLAGGLPQNADAQHPAPRDVHTALAYSFDHRDSLPISQSIHTAKQIMDTDPERARQLLRTAVELSRNQFDAIGLSNTLRPLLGLLSATERSRLLNELKLECSVIPPLWGALPVIYNALAKGYQLKGNYERAARAYMKAIPLAQRYVPDYLAVIYNNYGSLLLLLPENEKYLQSLYYLNKSETIARRTNDWKTITCVLCNKGKAFRNLKQYDKSLQLSVRALAIARQHGFRQWEYVLLNNIGDLYYVRGRLQKARYYLQQAEAIDDESMDPYYQNMLIFTLAEVYEALGQTRKAEQYYLAALQTAKEHHIGRDLIAANQKLSGFYAAQQRFRKAYRHLKAYSRLNQQLKNEEMLKNIQNLSFRYQTAENKKKLLQNELYIAHQQQLIQQKNRLLLITVMLTVAIAGFLISRFRHKRKLLLKEEKIKEMQAILRGEEKERTRLARELHDGIGGMLAAANMQLEVVQKDPAQNNNRLDEVSRLIGTTSEEVRHISHNLMPAALFRQNLEEAVRYYCHSIQKYGRLNIDLNIYGSVNAIPEFEMTFIFRAIQELMQNIIRHAGAHNVVISLERTGHRMQLIVEDDGSGFNTHTEHRGFGLENLAHRIKALKGKLDLRSEPGGGTSVLIEFSIGT